MSFAKSGAGTHCSCFPDSSVVLQLVFQEPEFAEKIAFFESSVKKLRVRNEILPWVNFEVNRRLTEASTQAVDVLRRMRSRVERVGQIPVNKTPLDGRSVIILEEAVRDFLSSLRVQYSKDERRYNEEARRTRVVETALVSKAQEAIFTGRTTTLGHVIDETMEEFADELSKFADRFSAFVNRIGATHLGHEEIPKPSPSLKRRLGAIVKNTWDVELLCQAACRMIHGNRWSALVSLDYADLVHHQAQIEKESLVLVCDPIYLGTHVEQRLGLNVTPREEARKRGLSDADFIEDPSRVRIV